MHGRTILNVVAISSRVKRTLSRCVKRPFRYWTSKLEVAHAQEDVLQNGTNIVSGNYSPATMRIAFDNAC